MKKRQILSFVLIATASFFMVSSCKKEQDEQTVYTYQVSRLKPAYYKTQKMLLQNFQSAVGELKIHTNAFYNLSGQSYLEACRERWKTAYEEFVLLGPYTNGYSTVDIGYATTKQLIQVYPINYRYVDYAEDSPNGGIINDVGTYPSIESLNMLHQVGGEQNCTIGFHVLEFLLWGEDLSLSGPGNTRDYKDYVTGGGGINVNRRRSFLDESMNRFSIAVQELKMDASYEKNIKSMDSKSFMHLMVGSLQQFIKEELVTKDIRLPLMTQNHHLEICDYSDHTLAILKKKIRGIHFALDGGTLFNGNGGTDYFLMDLISEVVPDEATKIRNQLDAIDSDFNAITMTFENAVLNPSAAAKLQQIADKLMIIHGSLDVLLAKFK